MDSPADEHENAGGEEGSGKPPEALRKRTDVANPRLQMTRKNEIRGCAGGTVAFFIPRRRTCYDTPRLEKALTPAKATGTKPRGVA